MPLVGHHSRPPIKHLSIFNFKIVINCTIIKCYIWVFLALDLAFNFCQFVNMNFFLNKNKKHILAIKM